MGTVCGAVNLPFLGRASTGLTGSWENMNGGRATAGHALGTGGDDELVVGGSMWACNLVLRRSSARKCHARLFAPLSSTRMATVDALLCG